MGEESAISWTHATFNPWWGCVEVSPACGLPLPGEEDEPHGVCYAKTWDERFPILGQTHWGKDAPRRFFKDAHFLDPIKWNKAAEKAGERRRVFCGSMCDIMEDRRDLDLSRERVYELVIQTPWLDWLFLTKRPQNYRKLLPKLWLEYPRNNVWLGTTLETPAYIWRAGELKNINAAVRWLSMEPLLAEFSQLQYELTLTHIDWVIFGGESGQHARNTPMKWIERGIKACRKVGSKPFMKQTGGNVLERDLAIFASESGRSMHHKAGADPLEWPARWRVQEFPTPRIYR